MAKIVLFVDAMEPKEYGAGWTDTERGLVESGYPKVTPKVTSEVYTGESPSENGMGAAHSISEGETHRPRIPTIQEKLYKAGFNVGSFYMPYCLPLNLENGMWHSEAMQEKGTGRNGLAQTMVNVPANLPLHGEDLDKDKSFNARREQIYARSSNLMNLIDISDLDVVFVGVRTPDQYTHFQWHEDYRTELLEVLAQEVSRWQVNHDILWWSDHGSEEKKDTFRVNKWLVDKGYLDLEIDLEFNERFTDEVESMNPQQNGGGGEIENQLSVHAPGVEIKESSQAVCMDPYDSCIDVMDEDLDVDKLIDELMSTGYYKGVKRAEDQWGEGQFIESCPDIVTHRADNVLVTGNVHPDPIGMGFYRSGVHSAFGAWGTTDETLERSGDVSPRELHDVIWEFVTGHSKMKEAVQSKVSELERMMGQ